MRDNHRKARLRHLIETDYGSSANFARETEFSKARVSQASGPKEPFAEDAATKWEDTLGLPRGWFNNTWPTPKEARRMKTPVDQPYPHATQSEAIQAVEACAPPDGYIRLEHLSPQPSMGGGAYLDEPTHVVRHLDVLEQWVRQKVGTTDPERIKVLTGHGQSMLPTIQDQDLVFVDIAQRSIEVAGIYVIDVAGRLLLKKALILSDGTLILRSDNTADYPDEERHDLARAADTICVAGRVLAWWTLRKG